MATTTFNDLITFSRGSNATVTGPNGLIQWAPSNLLTNSQDFEAAGWGKVRISVTANSTAAPDGTLTADTLNGSGGGTTSMSQTMPSTGGLHVATIYAKAGTKQFLQFSANAFAWGIDARANFDLQAGTLGTVDAGLTASIQDVGGGWYRCAVAANKAASAGALLWCIVDSASAAREASATAGTLITWGAQLELGSTATTYNNTSVRNLLGFSEAFDNAAWTKSASSIVTGAQANPVNGLFNAQKLMEDTTTANHGTQQSVTLVAVPYVYSVYLKAAGRSWAQLVNGSVGNCFAYFDLANGAVGTVGAGATSAAITAVGSGWYRCSILFTAASGGNIIIARNASANGTTSYTGDGNSGVYIYGAMLSNSASLDPYVPTPGAAPSSTAYYGPRFDYDPVTLLPRGLLVEEQRTNLLFYSEQFDNVYWTKSNITITANSAVAPDGTTTADTLTATSANGYVLRDVAFSGGAAGVNSVWMRRSSGVGSVTFYDIENNAAAVSLTSEWQRITSASATTIDNSARFRVQIATSGDAIEIWGAQLEAGAFATSYIPTIASTVTRSADVATITGSLFSQWYNQPAGGFVVEGDYAARINWRRFLTADDAAASGTNRMIINGDQDQQLLVTNGGVNQASLTAGTAPAANIVTKIASTYALDNFAAVRDGGTVATDTSGTIPTVNRLNIGLHPNGSEYLNGHIRSIRYVPVRAADFQLQQVTT
jgi:hypothetical protein